MRDDIQRLQTLISDRGWTWADFARELGTTDQRVYNWRKRGIPHGEGLRIASIFGVPAEWLMHGKGGQSQDIGHNDVVDPKLGGRIKDARIAADMSQAELAARCGWDSQSRVANYENNERVPKLVDIRKISEALGVSVDWLISGSAGRVAFAPGPPLSPLKEVPLVGTVEGGPDAHWEELGHPTGYGAEYLDVPSRDPNAYALYVSGQSMSPRMRPGEAVLVEPNHEVQPGDEVVIKLTDGQVMVKELAYRRAGRIALDSIADTHDRIVVNEDNVVFMHYVAGVFRAGSLHQR